MKFNFVISDDEKNCLKSTRQHLEKVIEKHDVPGEITLLTTEPEEVIQYGKRKHDGVNIYFLDINYNQDINGLGIARNIRDEDPYAYIIFLTAYPQLSMLSFKYKLKTFEFLVKPVSYVSVEECVLELMKDYTNFMKQEEEITEHTILIKSGYREYACSINDIMYIESFGQKLLYHTVKGKLETYGTLKEVLETLNRLSKSFCRCHKSYIVNVNYIKEFNIKTRQAIMNNGEICLVSRNYNKDLKESLEEINILSGN